MAATFSEGGIPNIARSVVGRAINDARNGTKGRSKREILLDLIIKHQLHSARLSGVKDIDSSCVDDVVGLYEGLQRMHLLSFSQSRLSPSPTPFAKQQGHAGGSKSTKRQESLFKGTFSNSFKAFSSLTEDPTTSRFRNPSSTIHLFSSTG